MWHLFKNKEGQFEFAFISKGEYIAGTKQGYERRQKALSSLFTMLHHHDKSSVGTRYLIQDDTGSKPQLISVTQKGRAAIWDTKGKGKPSKPYIP